MLVKKVNYPREFFKSQFKLYLVSIQGNHDYSDGTSKENIYNILNGLENMNNGRPIVRPSEIYSLIRIYSLKDIKDFLDTGNEEVNHFLNDPNILYALSYSSNKNVISWLLERENINLQIICKVCSWDRVEYSVLGEKPLTKFMEFLDALPVGERKWKEILRDYKLEKMSWWTKADFYEKFGVKNIKTADGGSVVITGKQDQTKILKKIHSHRDYFQSKIYLYLESKRRTHRYCSDNGIDPIENENINLKIICKIYSSVLDKYFRLGEKALTKFMEFLDEFCVNEEKWKQIVTQDKMSQIMLWTKADFRNHFGV